MATRMMNYKWVANMLIAGIVVAWFAVLGTPNPVRAATGTDMLGPDEWLFANQSITSADGRFTLIMQSDGNLVLYQNGVGALWSTGTVGSGADRLVMQSDGNLVVYTPHDGPVWSSNTIGERSILRIQNDGNLVIYRESGELVWGTNTIISDDPGRHVVLTVDDMLARKITEGGVFGLFGGKHDEPYFVVNPIISIYGEDGKEQVVSDHVHGMRVKALKKGQHARNIVLWDGYLKPHENLLIFVILMEDDGSVLRDLTNLPLTLGGALASCDLGHCINTDDYIGSFSFIMAGSGDHYFRDENWSTVRTASDNPDAADITLDNSDSDARYQLHVSLH